MQSIRWRLFFILLLTTGFVWLSAVAWIYIRTEKQVEQVLDARLAEAARMVSSLIVEKRIEISTAAQAVEGMGAADHFSPAHDDFTRQLSCQIWSFDGKLVSRSQNAPSASLSDDGDGFQQKIINGVSWRVFAVTNQNLGIRVLVGDSVEIRNRLVRSVVLGFIGPMAITLPFLALLIWICVGRGLAPLNRIATSLTGRPATDLSPFDNDKSPVEIRPLTAALNSLLGRVADLRERERNFLTYAAHELKTPLAGLKTQAQIAVRSPDEQIRNQALDRIITSVDRTGRMVRQLIDMAAVEATDSNQPAPFFAPLTMVQDVIDELRRSLPASAERISLQVAEADSLTSTMIPGSAILFSLALRNVLENAILYAPAQSNVICSLRSRGDQIEVVVSDRGPGIAPHLAEQITEPFFRASTHNQQGSGLGLAIVRMAVTRLKGELQFRQTDGNFCVLISLPTQKD